MLCWLVCMCMCVCKSVMCVWNVLTATGASEECLDKLCMSVMAQ